MYSIDNNKKSNRKYTGVRKTIASTNKISRNTIFASAAILLMGAMLALSSEARNSNLAFIAGSSISPLQQQQYLAFATNGASDLQQSSNTATNDTFTTTTITNTTLPTTAIPISDEPNHVAIIGQEAPFYGPGNITVKAGTTVTFKNHDAIDHTATGTNDGTNVSSPAPNNTFDTGLLKIGEEKQVTFDKAGTFHYFCSIHPFMRGTLTVTPA